MNEDPYAILGVKREATQDEIRSAYRRLAKQLHRSQSWRQAGGEKFKQVSGAYDILGDPESAAASTVARSTLRAWNGRGAIPRFPYTRSQDHAYTSTGGFADFMEGEDVLRTFSVAGRGELVFACAGPTCAPLAGRVHGGGNGTTKRITMPDGATLDVVIPAGTKDQQVLRCAARVLRGSVEDRPGMRWWRSSATALVHPQEDDIHIELPISLPEAVLGAKLDVPTPTGPVRMTVPKGEYRKVLGLKARASRVGTAAGAMSVTLKIMLPEQLDQRSRIRPPLAGGTTPRAAPRAGSLNDLDSEFIIRAQVEHEALEGWIAAGWIIPPQREPGRIFRRGSRARGLIRDLRDDLGVNDEGISVILHLLDQVHGLRRSMQHLLNEMRTGRPGPENSGKSSFERPHTDIQKRIFVTAVTSRTQHRF